jgi:integrase
MAFRGFYKWLQLQNIVQHRHALMLVNAVMEGRNTPLKFTLTPDQVLAFAASQGATDLGLMALVGYFFSLRTDELFGLRKEDFLAGSRAEALEASKVMKKRGLYHRLVIYVRQCRRASGEIYAPTKRKRGGFVACFDETAARKIVKVISALPDGLLFTQHTPGHYSKVWSANGITDITLKDLRRASLYYLGHYSDLNFVDLQNHARHNNPTTTALYTRRPEEAFDEGGENLLDLDA